MAVATVAVVADGSKPGGSADWMTTRWPPRIGALAAEATEARLSNINKPTMPTDDQRTAARVQRTFLLDVCGRMMSQLQFIVA